MTWDTVAQVLVILAGASVYQWIASREPRPRSVKVARVRADPVVKSSLVKELEELDKARDKLHREHARSAGEGYSSFADTAWAAIKRVEKRIEIVRDELKRLER